MTRRELRSLNSKYLRQIVDTIYSKHIKKTDLYLSGTYREQACFLKLNRKQSMREIQLSSNWRKPGSKFTMVEKHRHDECKTFDKHLTFLTFDIPAHVSLIWSAYDQPVIDIRKVTTPTTPQLCSNTYASRSERKILHGIERKKLGKFRDKRISEVQSKLYEFTRKSHWNKIINNENLNFREKSLCVSYNQ